MSTDLGSSGHTSPIIRPLLELLFPSAPPDALGLYEWYIRKLAHLTEYGVLGMLATRIFRGSLWTLWPLLIVLLVATTDEWHQSFLGSRTGSAYDVLIDTVGGGIGVLCVWLISRRHSTHRERAPE